MSKHDQENLFDWIDSWRPNPHELTPEETIRLREIQKEEDDFWDKYPPPPEKE